MIAIIIRPFDYESDIQILHGRKNKIRIENLTPVLTDQERLEQQKCIEAGLFSIFIQYSEPSEKTNHHCGAAAV